MAATVSPWAKPGAWALDSEEHEDELQQPQDDGKYHRREPEPLADFPDLSTGARTKSKKKKAQTLTLAEFSSGKAFQPSHTRGPTQEDLINLPTGPREWTAEELERNRGGFRSYGRSNGDDSSNGRWGSKGSDDTRRQGGFDRDSSRDSGPSRADEVQDWGAAKKSMVGNGFERKERGGGFFDSKLKADESDSWVSNKSFVPSEGRRYGDGERRGGFDGERRGGFERERRVSFDTFSNGGGADSDSWGKKREDGTGSLTGAARPRLNLHPRTIPVSNGQQESPASVSKPKGSNPFGDARPREEVLAEKGQDWKKIDEQLESMKIKEVAAVTTDRPSFAKRGFGTGNGRASPPEERSWRKSDSVDARPSSGKSENGGSTEEN